MNRTMKIVVSIILCVWIFAMGIELGAYRERKAINANISTGNQVQNTVQTTTTQPVPTETTTQPTPTETTTQASKTDDNSPTDSTAPGETTTVAPKNDEVKIPTSNEEIAKAYNDAVNATKNTTKTVNAVQYENVTMTIVDSTIPSMLQSGVNSILQGLMGEETHNFTNGVDEDGNTFKDSFPPSSGAAALEAAGIKSATSEAYGEGGYKLTISLVEEKGTYETPPKYHSVSVGYLNLDSLGLPVTITSADFNYPGATVTICVNGEGLIDTYEVDFPMNGTGTGKALGATASLTIDGGMDEKWTMTWQ